MNETLIHALSRKTEPKAQRPNKVTSSDTHKNKKVIIGNNPVQYPDGAVTTEEDCDRG